MTSSIQLSKDTKTKLMAIIAQLQQTRQSRVTYEDAILYLLDTSMSQKKNRLLLSKNYFGILNVEKARADLREGRAFER